MSQQPVRVWCLKTLLLWFAVLLALASLGYFFQKTVTVYHQGYFDLPIFVQAAIRHWQDVPVYERSADMLDRFKPGAVVFKFPPPYLFPLLPWFDASGQWPEHFHVILTLVYGLFYLVLVGLCCSAVLRSQQQSLRDAGGVSYVCMAVVIAALFLPFYRVLAGTSGEGLIILLAVLAFSCMQRWPLLAGGLLAWLVSIKLYPAFLLLYPLLTRQWRVLAGAVVGGAAIVVLSLLVFGVAENLFYLQEILPILLSEPVSEDWTTAFLHTTGNQGIVKVLVSYGLLPNRLPIWLNTVRLPFVAAMCLLLWHCARQHDSQSRASLLAYALVVTTMLLCLPNVFYAYFVVLLLPVLVLAGFYGFRRQWWMLAVLVGVILCFAVDDQWTYALAEQARVFNPSPAMLQAVSEWGVQGYLWRQEPLLALLGYMGLATPFLPYVLWLMLAAGLYAVRVSPGRKVLPAG